MEQTSKYTLKKIIAFTLSLLIGAVFIFSAISKMPTIEQFGWTIVETTSVNWAIAEWFARILIGAELFIGLLFIFQISRKKEAIPFAVLLLSAFTIYLLLVLKTQGNNGNCGCFGEVMPMTPLQSIIKNIVLMAFTILLYFLIKDANFKWKSIINIALFLAGMLVPFLWSPPESIYIYDKENDINEPIPLSMLYHSPNNTPPQQELREGKHILLFMSLTCKYCKKAAKRVRIMKEQYPEIPFYTIFNGDSTDLKPFFDETRMTNIPFSFFNGSEQFVELNRGTSLPSIKWTKDTTLIRESNYITLNENDIIKWLHE